MCGWRQLIILLVFVAGNAAGCSSFRKLFKKPPPKSDPIPPTTQIVQTEPIRVVSEPRPVKAGTLPLVYLLEHPGEIRVIDATAGVVLVGAQAGGRTILSVTEDRGVTIGGRTIRAGPLDATHRFEIYLSVPEENFRRSVFERR